LPVTSRLQRFSKALRNVKLNHSCHDSLSNPDGSLLGGLWSLSMPELYQTHPQLHRTESHNWRLRNSALQTAHALIHISFLLRTASAGTFPRSPNLKLDTVLLIACPLQNTYECKGRAIGKCFKTGQLADFHVAITSRIRESREETSILAGTCDHARTFDLADEVVGFEDGGRWCGRLLRCAVSEGKRSPTLDSPGRRRFAPRPDEYLRARLVRYRGRRCREAKAGLCLRPCTNAFPEQRVVQNPSGSKTC